jgi:hypothetical protein
MVKIRCKGTHSVRLQNIIALQGGLKKRGQADIDLLTQSLKDKGLLQPFVLWPYPTDEGKEPTHYKILDGHGRYTALLQMFGLDYEGEWPAIVVDAETEAEAKALLLEINARYGRITPKGLAGFLKDAPSIKVPANLGVRIPKQGVGTPGVKTQRTHRILRVKVEEKMYADFVGVLAKVPYVELL